MTKIYNVHGSKELAVPLILQVDTVYVKENIREESLVDPVSGEERTEWVWDETQYTYKEYSELITEAYISVAEVMEAISEGVNSNA